MEARIFPPIPADTVMAVRPIFGNSNFYLHTGKQANQLFDGLILQKQCGRFQKSVHTIAMLYLITIFQYVETLPDRQVNDALRKRVDWQYALHLSLNYPGLESQLFCHFREWLLSDPSGRQNFQTLVQRWFTLTGLLSESHQGLDAVPIIAAVCQISSLMNIWDALLQAMEAVATLCPTWLLSISLPHWYERYSFHRRNLELGADYLERVTSAQVIGTDGFYLLDAIAKSNNHELVNLDEVVALHQLWHEQFELVEGSMFWCEKACQGYLPIKCSRQPIANNPYRRCTGSLMNKEKSNRL